MVSKKTIQSYDFKTIDEYFEYIIDSRINGQKQQAKELYSNLSQPQKLEFNNWFSVFTFYDRDDMTETEVLNDMLNYLNT